MRNETSSERVETFFLSWRHVASTVAAIMLGQRELIRRVKRISLNVNGKLYSVYAKHSMTCTETWAMPVELIKIGGN